MIARFLLTYFICGLFFFTWTMYQLTRSGILDRAMEQGRFGKFMLGLIGVNFFLWPISVITNTAVAASPTLTASAVKWLRRQFVDKDDRFMTPQMPALCGSFLRVDHASGLPVGAMCVKPKNHSGPHANRHSTFPHDDASCPCEPREWTTEESACTHIRITSCVKHGEHEGRCQSAEGEEFDPTVPSVGPPI